MKTAIDIMKDAIALKERKSKDYQGSQFTESDYFPFGHTSYIHMLHTKMLRIRSVAEQESTNFESLTDSLIDMINYSAMYAAWVENNPEQSKELNESSEQTIATNLEDLIDTIKVDSRCFIGVPKGQTGMQGFTPFAWTAGVGKTPALAIEAFIGNHRYKLENLLGDQ